MQTTRRTRCCAKAARAHFGTDNDDHDDDDHDDGDDYNDNDDGKQRENFIKDNRQHFSSTLLDAFALSSLSFDILRLCDGAQKRQRALARGIFYARSNYTLYSSDARRKNKFEHCKLLRRRRRRQRRWPPPHVWCSRSVVIHIRALIGRRRRHAGEMCATRAKKRRRWTAATAACARARVSVLADNAALGGDGDDGDGVGGGRGGDGDR